jgi:uncharacterized protein (DUF433 family)
MRSLFHLVSMNANLPRIVTDPAVCGGKPHVAGTRLSAEFLQGLSATGWTRENILDTYPYLKPEDLDAALKFGL